MENWTAGYMSEIDYTYGYYAELCPSRIKLAFLNQGIVLPKIGAACELGFGQGLSTNIHAAGSSTSWFGTDFNSSQAGFARGLSSIAGIESKLFDQNFLEFSIRSDLPDFDYIALHGIWSWISDENRKIIVDFIQRKLKVGGVLYISYNTQPGWAGMIPIRDLLTEHTNVMSSQGDGIVKKINHSLGFVDKLMKVNSQFFRVNPQVVERLKQIKTQDMNYLAHEYFNRDWHPMSFSKLSNWLFKAKLNFACSANYLDHLEALNLSLEQQVFLKEIEDPIFRETVRDLIVNQQFRKDYWVKGIRKLNSLERLESLREEQIILAKTRKEISLEVSGHLGKATMRNEIYEPLLTCLSSYKPQKIGEIENALSGKVSFQEIMESIMVLANNGTVLIAQSDELCQKSRESCERLNLHFIHKARASSEIQYLVSPLSGSGVFVGRFNQLFILALSKGIPSKDWAKFVWGILSEQGQNIVKNGKKLETEDENLLELQEQAKDFERFRLPILKSLMIV